MLANARFPRTAPHAGDVYVRDPMPGQPLGKGDDIANGSWAWATAVGDLAHSGPGALEPPFALEPAGAGTLSQTWPQMATFST